MANFGEYPPRLPFVLVLGLELEIVNSDGCGPAEVAERKEFFGCGGRYVPNLDTLCIT